MRPPTPRIMPFDLTERQLALVARAKVFFGHQSVGTNLLEALPALFAEYAVRAPVIGDPRGLPSAAAGYLAHAAIGVNEQPLLKIEEFDTQLRAGIAAQVDVAMMKLCFVDVAEDTDVDALFTSYRDTLAGLARDFPTVSVLATTVPLTTPASLGYRLRGTAKALLGGRQRFGPAENAVRERLNSLIRREFPGPNLFDLAAVESTRPDGTRVRLRYRGGWYFALHDGYAKDLGHLNHRGARAAATAWLAAVARACQR